MFGEVFRFGWPRLSALRWDWPSASSPSSAQSEASTSRSPQPPDWPFLSFWPADAGGCLGFPFRERLFALAGARPRLGLAFAAARSVHLGIVASLCVIGHAPDLHTFVIFGVAAGFTHLLALLSIRQIGAAHDFLDAARRACA